MPQPLRRFQRLPVDSVTGTLRSPGDLEILDLSRNGISFATSARLEPGSSHVIELRHRGQPVKLAVDVRWVEAAEPGEEDEEGGAQAEEAGRAGPRFHAGTEIVDVLEKTSTGIWDWILPAGTEEPEPDDDGWPP